MGAERIPWPEPVAPIAAMPIGWRDDGVSTIPILEHRTWTGQPTPDREWLLHEFIPMGQTTYLTGPGSAGKSLFGQQLVACVAAGLPMLGVETRQCPALYLTCEDDPDELHRRHKAITATLRVGDDDLGDSYALASLYGEVGTELCRIVDGKVDLTEAYHRLERTVRINGTRFVVLDNVAHLFAGNENDCHHVATFVAALNRLAKATGCAVLLLGHPNKAGDAFSGSTAWENQVRSRLYLETPADSIDRDVRVLSRQKANYAQNGETIAFRWHQWAFVRDEDLPADTAAEMAATVAMAHDNGVFLACLDERNRQERPVSEQPASRTYAPKVFADMAESKRIGRVRLEAAMDRLFRIAAIERGFIYRDAGEGKDRFGVRRPTADLSADLPLTGSADLPLTTRRPPPSLTPSTTYYSGAAAKAVAPFHDPDDITWPDHAEEHDHD